MQQMLKIAPQSRLFIISSLICLMNFQPLNAQTIIPPSNPESSFPLNVSSRPEVLNVDMLSTTSGPLKAFVSSFSSSLSGNVIEINISDGAGQSAQKLASAPGWGADVTLINDGTSTTSYKLCIVYLNGNNDAKLDVYTISGVGTPSLQISNSPATYTIATSINAAFPFAGLHIDGFVDPNTIIGGYPKIDNIIICWTEKNISSNQYSLKVKYGIPGSFSSGTVVPLTANTLYLSNVAASTNKTTGKKSAYLTYVQNQEIYFAQFDIASNSTVASNFIMPFGGSAPIIDAMGIYDPNYSKNPWIIANMTANNNFPISVFDQMNPGGFICNSSLAQNGSVNFGVSIAAGLGTSFNNFCNRNYVIGYEYMPPSGNPEYVLTNAVDAVNGSVSSTYPYYYQANNGTSPGPANYLVPNIAMSSCSNSGINLLTSWINEYKDAQGNYRVHYKLVGDVTGYKPTSVSSTEQVTGMKLFPNPVHSKVTIKGTEGTTHYAIINIAGQVISFGYIYGSQNEIDVHELTAGVYVVHLTTDGGKSIKLNFLKM